MSLDYNNNNNNINKYNNNRLWEAIRLYMSSCRNELLNQADFSINNVILKLKKRLEVRLEMHKPRYQRVKVQIYDVRHKELEEHALDFKRMENVTFTPPPII